MGELEALVAGVPTAPAPGWTLAWVDRERGIARVQPKAGPGVLVLVEEAGQKWIVILRGRRIEVEVLSWRERMLAEAATQDRTRHGRLEVRSTLPGLVVNVHAVLGSDVAEGESLVTVEAMKMQNEVRAPRPGQVVDIAVAPGQTVAAGALLVVLE
jgi:acetyl/propionyl-CoA carboxylase alpha subunit